jgi:Zn-dependent peptidase ImmA (M78 family)
VTVQWFETLKKTKVTTRIPINTQVLVWARETSGLTLNDMRSSFKNLDKLESGEQSPTYNQLEQLAEKYHRPLAVFFFPEPPLEESIEKSLRSLSNESLNSVSPKINLLFRKAKAFQIALTELLEEQHDAHREKISWMKVSSKQSPKDIATYVREILKVSTAEQSSWKDSDEALKKWRNVLAENGIFIFKEAFKTPEVSGFCIYDDLFPIIFVNNSQTKNRQIFTIFHEVGHLLFRQSYLDIFGNDFWELEFKDPMHEEVACNTFAGEFLVPAADFEGRIQEINLPTDSVISQLASVYHVSREVILRRFLDHHKITQENYRSKTEEWREQYAEQKDESSSKKKGGGNYYNTKAAYLGSPYISLVFQQYYKGAISSQEASEYLDIRPKSFPGIEESFLKGGL